MSEMTDRIVAAAVKDSDAILNAAYGRLGCTRDTATYAEHFQTMMALAAALAWTAVFGARLRGGRSSDAVLDSLTSLLRILVTMFTSKSGPTP